MEKKNKNQGLDEYGRENLWRGSEDSSLIGVIDFYCEIVEHQVGGDTGTFLAEMNFIL